MAGSGFHVEGLRETVRSLEQLGVDVDDLKDAMQSLSVEGANIARIGVDSETGSLAGSIRGNRAKGRAVVTAGRGKSRDYAGVQNYGWPARNIRAQGFMQEADRRLQPIAISRFEDAIEDAIRRRGLG